jgi:hypothetical protein
VAIPTTICFARAGIISPKEWNVGKPDLFSVTISRINESANVDPYHTMNAYSVTEAPDGSLIIEGNHEDRVFGKGLWDNYEITPFDAA